MKYLGSFNSQVSGICSPEIHVVKVDKMNPGEITHDEDLKTEALLDSKISFGFTEIFQIMKIEMLSVFSKYHRSLGIGLLR